jgi:amidase
LYSITCDTLGFYARSIEDLNILADVFKLSDDVPTPEIPLTLTNARIGFCKTPIWPHKVTPALEAAWSKAQDILKHHGASVEDVELPQEFSQVTKWHSAVLAGEGRTSFLGRMSSIFLT